MYEELVKRLRHDSESRALMFEAAEAIEELSKPRWIPVTDRLPDAGQIVLVYGKKGGIYTAKHNPTAMWPGSFWKLNSKSHYCEPTHWMPLPPAPEPIEERPAEDTNVPTGPYDLLYEEGGANTT